MVDLNVTNIKRIQLLRWLSVNKVCYDTSSVVESVSACAHLEIEMQIVFICISFYDNEIKKKKIVSSFNNKYKN